MDFRVTAGGSNLQLLSSHGDTLREKPQADDDSQKTKANQLNQRKLVSN